MNLNTVKSIPPRRKTYWLTLAIVLVFLLLSLVVWRWFDYQIARLSFPNPKSETGILVRSFADQHNRI